MPSKAQSKPKKNEPSNGSIFDEPAPPQNLNAERWLLGAILINPELAAQAVSLPPAFFTIERHRRIFRRMMDLHGRGEDIQYTTVYLEMQEHGEADTTLLSYLVDLPTGLVETEFTFGFYLRMVQKVGVQRGMYFAGHKAMLEAVCPTDDLKVVLSDHQRDLAQLAERYQFGAAPLSKMARLQSIWSRKVQMNYVIEGLLLEGALTMLAGESGDGKSTLSLSMAGHVAQGKPFLGRAVKQRKVLYLDRENPDYVVQKRLADLQIPEIPEQLKIWGRWEAWEPAGPDDPEVVEFARQKPLIIFDSLISFARCDENSSQEMRRHMELYKRLCDQGASVLFIHHASDKGDSLYRGSSDIKAVIDSGLHLSRADGSESGDALKLLNLDEFKTRGTIGGKIRMEFRNDGFYTLDAPRPSPKDILKDLLRLHPLTGTRELRDLAQEVGLHKRVLEDTLGRLISSGEVVTKKGSRGRLLHHLPGQEPEQTGIALVNGVQH
jgi:hypothetical protein